MIACLLSLVVAPQSPDLAAALASELKLLVQLPTAAARSQAAERLAGKQLAPLERWRAACAAFGEFLPLEPGPSRQQVALRVLDKDEQVELFLFVPKGYAVDKPAPLLVWGHGAGDTGADQYTLWQEVADRIGMLVLAITSIEPEPGYHFSPREREATLAALRWTRLHANIDENAIFVGGWSQGGHQAWDLALRWPDRWAGVVAVVGGPRLELGARNNLRYLENAWALPIRDLQGSQDDARLLANLHLAFARLAKVGNQNAKLHEFPDRGHDADLGAEDWPAFFATRRQPLHKRVVRLAAEPGETRAGWLEVSKWSDKATSAAVPQVPATYHSLDDAGQRALLCDRYAELTARVVVEDKGQGRFAAEGKLVTSFALLLTPEQLGKDGVVEVALKGTSKPVKKTATADVAVLLREFAERFDRTFLPVARVSVP